MVLLSLDLGYHGVDIESGDPPVAIGIYFLFFF